MLDWLLSLDRELLLFFNGHHNPFWDAFMMLTSGKVIWFVFYFVIIAVVLNTFGWKKGGLIILSMILVIVLSDQIASSVFKPIFKRFRPSRDPSLSHLVHIVKGYTGGKYGFASSHASNSFGLAVFVSLLFKNRATSVFIIFWAVLVSYSRIYLGVHYPGDIIVGALIGTLSAYFVYSLLRKYSKPSLICKPVQRTHAVARIHQIPLLGSLQIIVMLLSVFYILK
ncbi:phosphatase PAP2 family protein [Labilibaculum sp.]|uniref:phosphatase PAP2 family protein n=1 Tax=Labilibaculum sp. TaxID=2060723 RepID=UPI002AA7F81C|nr:phosphatase PAP2 family protein [Labilibaculum sp.]